MTSSHQQLGFEEENEELLSDYTSATSFFDDVDADPRPALNQKPERDVWAFSCYRNEGRVHVLGEWSTKSKAYRYIVIGPDIFWIILTYVLIMLPSYFIYVYYVQSELELIFYFVILGICIFSLTSSVLIDPGLVRKYHHARSRRWTYCDRCESFRPPATVHCSTCQICVADYDHHCAVSFLPHLYLFL
jgi:hypothetical protein